MLQADIGLGSIIGSANIYKYLQLWPNLYFWSCVRRGFELAYLVHTQRFEGPLGLLLHLIRKEEMDIFDINMVEVTRQYLDYIKMMKELDLEVAGDFVSMAATLIYIKSRMLLPQYNEEGEIIETEDPRKVGETCSSRR